MENNCNCGCAKCKKVSAFGGNANSFFKPGSGNSLYGLPQTKQCLSTLYGDVKKLSRFGNSKKNKSK